MKTLLHWFNLPKTLPTSFDATHGWTLSWVLPLIASVVAIGYAVVARSSSGVGQRRAYAGLNVTLGLTALLAFSVYADFGVFRYGTYMNEWDVYHYYLGSKYAPELGANAMYEATLVADAGQAAQLATPMGPIRDLSTLEYIDAAGALAHKADIRACFTDARWQEFVADVAFFKEQLGKAKWSTVLRDHGYNGTPTWSAVVGGLLTNHLSIRDPLQRAVLLGLDPLLFLVAFAVLGQAFGFRMVGFMAVLVGTHYLLSWGHLKGCLLRTDFALCAVMSIAMVKLERYKTAGVLIGLATLSRVFPVLLLAGLCAQGLDELIRKRRLNRELLVMGAAFLATIALGVLVAIPYGGERSLWGEWVPKVLNHYEALVDWNMGYPALANARWQLGVPKPIRWGDVLADQPNLLTVQRMTVPLVQLAFAVPALVFSCSLRRWEAMAFGFVFFFLFVQTSYYYYLFLIVPLMFFAADVDRMSRAIGVALMLCTGAFGYLLYAGYEPLRGVVMFRGWKQYFPTYYFLSWAIGLTCLYMFGLAALQARTRETKADTKSTANGSSEDDLRPPPSPLQRPKGSPT